MMRGAGRSPSLAADGPGPAAAEVPMMRHDAPAMRMAKANEGNGWDDGLAALGGLVVLAGANAALSYLIFIL